jgi:hypothetical protein
VNTHGITRQESAEAGEQIAPSSVVGSTCMAGLGLQLGS